MNPSVGAAFVAVYGAALLAVVGFLLNNRGPKYEREITKSELEILKQMKEASFAQDSSAHLEAVIRRRVASWQSNVSSRYWRGITFLFGAGLAIQVGASAIQVGRPEISIVTEQMNEYAVSLLYLSSLLVIIWFVKALLILVRDLLRGRKDARRSPESEDAKENDENDKYDEKKQK